MHMIKMCFNLDSSRPYSVTQSLLLDSSDEDIYFLPTQIQLQRRTGRVHGNFVLPILPIDVVDPKIHNVV